MSQIGAKYLQLLLTSLAMLDAQQQHLVYSQACILGTEGKGQMDFKFCDNLGFPNPFFFPLWEYSLNTIT